jgi:hypothetical protein
MNRDVIFEYWRGKGFQDDGEEQEDGKTRCQIFLSEIEVSRLLAEAISLALV